MANSRNNGRPHPKLVFGDTLSGVVQTFRTNPPRFIVTALGMVIGTASLILVVTVGLTGKQYIIQQIQNIGSNMMVAEYEGGSKYGSQNSSDLLTLADWDAARERVPGISASSPMIEFHDQVPIPGGQQREIVANTLYGSQDAAIGQQIKLSGLPFTVIGTFKERVDTFGESEISDNTILIPYTVARFFTASDTVKQLFFSVSDSAEVPRATEEIQDVLQSRHRPESVYKVYNLPQLLSVAAKTANTLTTVLLLISVFTLLVSGVGIMNIMLATVNSRIREIGDRKAVGATNSEIRAQFLTEAILISLVGASMGGAPQ